MQALDHRPDGRLWPHTATIRQVPGWVRFRLAAWRRNPAAASPLGSSPSQQRAQQHPEDRARARAVAERLLARLLLNAYPDQKEREHAIYWLGWPAGHMGANRDIAWWHVPTWLPRWQLRAVFGLVVGFGFGFAFGFGFVSGPVFNAT